MMEVESIQSRLNGHTSMWVKLLNLGQNWKHEDRMRESLIHKSHQIPVMSLLVKDHKANGPDGLPSTRPVVGACKGMNVPLSDLLSELLEPIASTLESSGEAISSEHMLNSIDELNRKSWRKDMEHHRSHLDTLVRVQPVIQ